MKITCVICCIYLSFLAVCGAASAVADADALMIICFGNVVALRAVQCIGGVCALFLMYALLFLKPFGRVR